MGHAHTPHGARTPRLSPALAFVVMVPLVGCGASAPPPSARGGPVAEPPAATHDEPAPAPAQATRDTMITQAPGGDGADGDDIVGWSTELDAPAPTLVRHFAEKAESYGCQAVRRRSESVVLKCPEAPMVMLHEGLKVTIGCKGIPLDECRSLFRRISEQE